MVLSVCGLTAFATHLIPLGLLACLAVSSLAQSFQNLDFEQATVTGGNAFGTLFPQWQASSTVSYGYTGTNTSVVGFGLYDGSSGGGLGRPLDTITIGIYDAAGAPALPIFHAYPVFGNYTAYVEADLAALTLGRINLSQTGLVPFDARSIWFQTTSFSSLLGFSARLTLQINGQDVPYYAMDVEPTYTRFAADVSSFAGSVDELRFAIRADYPNGQVSPGTVVYVALGLDNVAFSPQAIPEPRALFLAPLALLLFTREKRGGQSNDKGSVITIDTSRDSAPASSAAPASSVISRSDLVQEIGSGSQLEPLKFGHF